MLSAVSTNRELSAKLQLDIATTRKLRRPSDDPAGLVKMERLKTLASKNEQYVKNMTLMNDSMNASQQRSGRRAGQLGTDERYRHSGRVGYAECRGAAESGDSG